MSLASHFLALILGTVVALFPIIDPLAAAPVFLAITEGDSKQRRKDQLRRACVYMVAILACFLIGGTFLMRFFGISLSGIRIAGGLLVGGIGWQMLMGPPGASYREDMTPEARSKPDISFSPLAMPMLSGPGSIAVTVGFTSLAKRWLDYVAIILGIILVAIVSYAVLRIADRVVRVIGPNGMNALTRMMGFILVCVGVQFVVNGLISVAAEPELIKAVRNATCP